MFKKLTNSFKKSRLAVLGTAFAFSIVAAGVITVASPSGVAADGCDKVNIVHCGLSGSSTNGYINSFQAEYNDNSDNGHHDLKSTYQWAGATTSNVSAMSSSNTKLGYMYKNGNIKVDGKIVATDSWVTARFTEGAGFKEISNGVWARKTTTSLAESKAQVLVHFDANGEVDFAVMTSCGNAVKATPVPAPKPKPTPKPTPTLTCVSLTQQQVVGQKLTYKFVATAAASHTKIQKYVFTYSDGTTDTVASSATTASASHIFPSNGTAYVTSVAVSSDNKANVTSNACKVSFSTPAVEECKPGVPVGSADCDTPVPPSTPTPPTTLVKTGMSASSIFGLFAIVTLGAAMVHRYLTRVRYEYLG